MSRSPLILAAPAKVNTFLAVGPPDARGWHPLRTVFQAIDLGDELTVRPSVAEDHVTFSVAGIPARNTVTQALSLLRERVEVPPIAIHVEKRIPTKSGFGGGSSDAAAVLRALGGGLPEAVLHEIALRIGADVPFFLIGGRARAEGYGERLTPLPDLLPRWLVLARPQEGCATPEMFQRLDKRLREFRDFPEGDPLYNDFECVAPRASQLLVERLLAYGANDAGLTGSGSAVFGRFPDESSARRAAESLSGEAPWTRVARTLVTKS